MGKLSPFGASLEGFRLIARRPASFLIWTIIMGALMAVAIGAFYVFGYGSPYGGGRYNPSQALLRPFLIFGVALPTYLFGAVTVAAAVYRALLDPRAKGTALVRFSADEGRLFVVALVLGVVFLVADVAATVGIVGGMSLAHVRNIDATGIAYLVTTLVLAMLMVVLFSLALPMTLVDKRIRIFNGWPLALRSFWRVLAAFALVFLYMLILAVFFFALGWGINSLFGLATRMPWGATMGKAHPAFPKAQAVATLIDTVFGVVHYTLQLVLLSAAQAAIYRRLAGNVGDDVAQVF